MIPDFSKLTWSKPTSTQPETGKQESLSPSGMSFQHSYAFNDLSKAEHLIHYLDLLRL